MRVQESRARSRTTRSTLSWEIPVNYTPVSPDRRPAKLTTQVRTDEVGSSMEPQSKEDAPMNIKRAPFFFAITGALMIAGAMGIGRPGRTDHLRRFRRHVEPDGHGRGHRVHPHPRQLAGPVGHVDHHRLHVRWRSGPPPTAAGNVSGTLPATVTLDNQNPSLYFETLTYQTFLSYQVTFTSTPGNSSSPDTTFAFYLFDASGNPISHSNSPSGEAFDININGQTGRATLVPYYPPPPITVVPASVPEPSSMMLMGMGAVVGWGRWLGRRLVVRAGIRGRS